MPFALSAGDHSGSRCRRYKPSDSHRWKVAFCPSRCAAWKRIRANPTAAARLPDTGKICLKEMASASGVGWFGGEGVCTMQLAVLPSKVNPLFSRGFKLWLPPQTNTCKESSSYNQFQTLQHTLLRSMRWNGGCLPFSDFLIRSRSPTGQSRVILDGEEVGSWALSFPLHIGYVQRGDVHSTIEVRRGIEETSCDLLWFTHRDPAPSISH